MNPEHQPKISPAEIYFLVVFAVIADLLNWIPFLNLIVTIFTLPAFQFYFYFKGIKGFYSLGGNIIELIPALSVLPGVTTGVVITILIDRVTASKLGQTALKSVAKNIEGPAGTIAEKALAAK